MFAIRNKTFFCVRNFILSLANVLLLGVHFYHRYYQYTSYHHYHFGHLSNAITAIHITRPEQGGWHYNLGKKTILDKRYSPQHIYCLFFRSITLSSFEKGQKHVPCCEQMHARAVFLRRSSRGPPMQPSV